MLPSIFRKRCLILNARPHSPLKCLHLVLTQDDHLCWAFAIDSKYVVDGATGGAARWKDSNWTTRSGKLASHVDLWLEILPLLDALGQTATISHVFPHIYLRGNDRAEVQVVMSSDEELDTIYLAAKRIFLSSGASMHLSPKPHRSPTPQHPSPTDFSCGTPDPPDLQDFF